MVQRLIPAPMLAPVGLRSHAPRAIIARRLVGYSALVLLLNTLTCRAADFPAPSGRFTFEGKPYIGTATLTNSIITNSVLYFSGKYEWPPEVFRPLALDYRRFTVVAKLRPESISQGITLLVGGIDCRWFVLDADKDGRVELSFNNHAFSHPVEGLTITNGQWITLGLTFDLQSRSVVVYANGKRADGILLPETLDLQIISDAKWKDSDKHLTFTDGANGGTFRGAVAGLLTFNTVLSANQMRLLFPNK